MIKIKISDSGMAAAFWLAFEPIKRPVLQGYAKCLDFSLNARTLGASICLDLDSSDGI